MPISPFTAGQPIHSTNTTSSSHTARTIPAREPPTRVKSHLMALFTTSTLPRVPMRRQLLGLQLSNSIGQSELIKELVAL
jgi:hypothetical protein